MSKFNFFKTTKLMRSTPCSVCGESLKCGAGTGSCWCKSFPPIMPLDFDQDCHCPACLSKAVDKQIDILIKENGIEQMLLLAEPYRNHGEVIEYLEHVDYEIKDGLYIFSKWQHIKRSKCCDNGCQNCPY